MINMEKGTGGFINPEKVIGQLDVKRGMTVADFGCGHGYFTIPVARLVGSEGRVFAIDVLAEALEAVRSRAQIEQITNIETIRGNLETYCGSGLPERSVDMVLLHNVLFQSNKKIEIIKEAKRVLRISGIFMVADWLPVSSLSAVEKAVIGPPDNQRLLVDEARKLVGDQDFKFLRDFDAGEYHYGLIFIKP
jgi:ubiquinone/menaquinone biosynthesis C-methylase UbiE